MGELNKEVKIPSEYEVVYNFLEVLEHFTGSRTFSIVRGVSISRMF
jgi:hypothetical protein